MVREDVCGRCNWDHMSASLHQEVKQMLRLFDEYVRSYRRCQDQGRESWRFCVPDLLRQASRVGQWNVAGQQRPLRVTVSKSSVHLSLRSSDERPASTGRAIAKGGDGENATFAVGSIGCVGTYQAGQGCPVVSKRVVKSWQRCREGQRCKEGRVLS